MLNRKGNATSATPPGITEARATHPHWQQYPGAGASGMDVPPADTRPLDNSK